MKILIVTYPEAVKSIHVYSAKCSQNLRDDVIAALIELDFRVEPGEDIDVLIDKIVDELEHGRNYWFKATYCFSVICV